jgi:CO dehydrogenase/acetyl-CoA synthase beta subunit
MADVKIKGLEELQGILKEAERAVKELEGKFATLKVDPNNPQAAIAEMERTVDSKLSRYRSNPLVEQLSRGTKEEMKRNILKQADEAKRSQKSV